MFGIYPNTTKKLNEIFKNHRLIDEVIIYGSRAKGNFREGSDIDLTVKGNISDTELSEIRNKIEESLIPYLFDLSIYDEIQSASLKEHIDRVGKVLYRAD